MAGQMTTFDVLTNRNGIILFAEQAQCYLINEF